MGETEVCSPVSRRGSAVGSQQPTSPGAFSNPRRGDARRDFTPAPHPPPSHAKHSEPPPGEPPPAAQTKVVGPED